MEGRGPGRALPRRAARHYRQDSGAGQWVLVESDDEDSTQQSLDLVYSPTTLIIDIADYAGRGVQAPVSSSTKPDLMIRMLEALEVTDGMRVLEIGTGTGYNAALLSHRLGDDRFCSVDIDPQLVSDARQRLAGRGFAPTLAAVDGAEGLAEHGPFDRIIAI